jgi:alanine racemase
VRKGDSIQLFSWGKKDAASVQILSFEKKYNESVIRAKDQRSTDYTRSISITIPFTDDASIQNAITCWCVLLHLQTDDETISKRMSQLRNVEMRLELKQGVNNCSVINDSYSADLNSLTIALDFLVQQQQHPNRTLILSDILQSGKSSADLYKEVAFILKQKKINRLIGIGPEISKNRDVFKSIAQQSFFSSIAEFMQQFYSLHFFNETILAKGCKVFEFEQISPPAGRKSTPDRIGN